MKTTSCVTTEFLNYPVDPQHASGWGGDGGATQGLKVPGWLFPVPHGSSAFVLAPALTSPITPLPRTRLSHWGHVQERDQHHAYFGSRAGGLMLVLVNLTGGFWRKGPHLVLLPSP